MSVVGPCCRCISYPSLNIQLSVIHASNAKFLGATKDLGCVLLLSLVYVFIKRTQSPNPPIIKKWKCPEGVYTGKRLWFYFWNNQEYPCILQAWAVSDKVVHGLPVLCALFVHKQRHSADCALVTRNMTCTTNPPSMFFTIRKTEAKTKCSTWQLHQWEVSRVTVPLGLTQFKSISIKLI